MDEKDNGGPISPTKKLAANRRNAQLSTGPKTEAGKNHSRLNALKHGVLASALLVTKGGGAEDAAEFEELLHALNRDLAPVGRLEEMMVEKIAVCSWRQKRALRYEALMIRRASGEDSPELYEGIEYALSIIRNHFRLENSMREANKIFERHGISKPRREPDTASTREEAIAGDPKDWLLQHLLADESRSDSELNKAIYHFGLPEDAEMNRILRYETVVQRQLVYAINQLERLQRARRGEHVPAPVSVQVSSDQ